MQRAVEELLSRALVFGGVRRRRGRILAGLAGVAARLGRVFTTIGTHSPGRPLAPWRGFLLGRVRVRAGRRLRCRIAPGLWRLDQRAVAVLIANCQRICTLLR